MPRQKCRFHDGIKIKPDGVNELDPCVYVTKEIHQNVTVEVSQCKNCGHIEIAWHRQDDTISDYMDELDEEPEDG